MREVSEDDAWNFYWTDMSVSIERAKEMKRFQRINHFPGMLEICRKDLLARNLNRMQKIYPKEYNFFPKTWCLPADLGEALNYSKTRKNKTFIIKPECGSQGRGIYLTRSLKDLKPVDKLICQVYLAKPYLVDGYKFDIRVYTLITSCDPLRIFVYNEGLVRFATSRYADPNITNTTNIFMHLTNYALNKHSRTYVYDSEAGSKRKISTLNKILASQGVDLDRLWASIDQVIVKTIIAAWPILKHSYHACFPSHDMIEQFGSKAYGFTMAWTKTQNLSQVKNSLVGVAMVNHSPSFHTDTQLDREVKDSLMTDTFSMLNVWQCDKRRVLDEDRRRIRDRLLQTNKYANFAPQDDKEPEKSSWQIQVQWEETHLGNFSGIGGALFGVFIAGQNHQFKSLPPLADETQARTRDKTFRILANHSQILKEFGWKVLMHPTYNPDLASSDFHLFRSLQNSLRRVYPVGERYAALFEQPMGSLYSGTAASRARGDCTRIQLEEFQQSKAKAEALKIQSQPRPSKDLQQQDLIKQKSSEPSQPVLPATNLPAAVSIEKSPKNNNSHTEKEQKRKKEKEERKEKEKLEREREKPDPEKPKFASKQLTQKSMRTQSHINSKLELWTRAHEKIYHDPKEIKPPCVTSSYEPGRIVEKEERERVNLLAQRDFLIKSYGMLEQVYLMMKKLGTLRPEDERKYGVYGRLSAVTNTPKIITKDQKNKEMELKAHVGNNQPAERIRPARHFEKPKNLLILMESSERASLVAAIVRVRRQTPKPLMFAASLAAQQKIIASQLFYTRRF
ncbi:Tubulin polyglutamylase TTLL6 [Eumeta japonica]|uniref:Tubulin polyglutamylase TTLL6 n=1 Tax=Eumeta variegata TaxID=151549 RepID=A0A4C1UYP8_EUMVA|nr:Tubulin polyglutamylase TTLL6 [Eumeta japonica]